MARTPAAERARRLIAIIGQLSEGARIAVADLAAELGATEAELTADLETLSLCGVAPYYPDDLAPLLVEDGYVEVWGELPALKGPVRLSAAEASALAAALEAAGFSASDDLPARLLAATGAKSFDAEELAHTVRAATSAHDATVYQALARAVQEREILRLDYVTGGGTQATTREVEPLSLFAERGAWYLTAWCRRANDWRTFRADRIRSAGLTGERFDASARTGAPGAAAFQAAGLPVARLRFSAGEPFTDRDWPGGRVVNQADDGSLVAEVPYGGTAWIARRVVARLGSVEVLEPAEVRGAVCELATGLRGA